MSERPHLTTDELATERTAMAADRTLMAWTRTALSMISFGFTVYKFLQYMRETGSQTVLRPEGPRNFGLTLIAIGTLSLLIASAQHMWIRRRLGVPWQGIVLNLSLVVAVLISLLGLAALMSVYWRIGPF